MRELLKWLQGVGIGLAYTLGDALWAAIKSIEPSAPLGSIEQLIQIAILTILARAAGWLVRLLPSREA